MHASRFWSFAEPVAFVWAKRAPSTSAALASFVALVVSWAAFAKVTAH
jgi:hypothetical protein